MAGRSHINWGMFLTLLRLGVSQASAAPLVGVKPATPYVKACRDPVFASQVDAAMALGQRSLIASPTHFALPTGELLLDSNFEAIPREPPNGLRSWMLIQLSRNPLADLFV